MINILNIFKQKEKKITFTKEQLRLVKHIVNYGWHRASCHKTPLSCRKEDIDKLRLSLGIINKSKL